MFSRFISKYHVAIFGNFDSIVATPDVISHLYSSFIDQQIIPIQYQEQSVALSKDEVKHYSQARISLKSLDQKFEIKFRPERCDFTFTDFIDDTHFSPIQFAEKVINSLKIISDKYTAHYHRIGFVVEVFYDNLELNNVITNLNILEGSELQQENFIEYNNKMVYRKNLDALNETLNFSFENHFINGEIKLLRTSKSFKGIRSVYDINTLVQDSSNRFNQEGVEQYLNLVIPQFINLEKQNISKFN